MVASSLGAVGEMGGAVTTVPSVEPVVSSGIAGELSVGWLDSVGTGFSSKISFSFLRVIMNLRLRNKKSGLALDCGSQAPAR